ncbi:DEAD/DEAH box helicase [bacterium]|nr:DEAD/DEAH box helicase [bacterium]
MNLEEDEMKITPDARPRLGGDGAWQPQLLEVASTQPEQPELLFWRSYARSYLSGLCQLPAGQMPPPPTPAECDRLALTMPPMEGAEYLAPESFGLIWQDLNDWSERFIQSDGLDAFLSRHAPRWRQVGRVYFHLAENKNDEDYPFAFLTTYTTGLSQGGRLQHTPLRKCLETYAGARNKQGLIKLLAPIQRAAESLGWVQDLLDSGQIYQATRWSVDEAYQLLQSSPVLEESGLSVLLPDWWKRRPRPRVSVTVGPKPGTGLDAESLLQFEVQVEAQGDRLSAEELRGLLNGPDGLVRLKGQWVEVDRERLRQALEHWQSLQKRGSVSFFEGMRLLAGATADLGASKPDEQRAWVQLEAGRELQQLLAGLRQPENLPEIQLRGKLRAQLRPYQQRGVNWLSFLAGLGLGACLADDMGLGKTLQVLATLLARSDGGPSLLVAPASLLGNWKSEAARFAPGLQLVFAHSSESDPRQLKALETGLPVGTHLVVTTYSQVTRQSWLQTVDWQLIILDEAQAIKNSGTRQSQAVKRLKAKARIALTGTPVENRLGDLWSLFDFLNPGLLGSAKAFAEFVKGLGQQFAPLRQLVGPYILRRLKTDRRVITDLPDKIETPTYCGLSKLQIKLYEGVLRQLAQSLQNSGGIQRKGLVLQSLLQLKQICNHPAQFTGSGDYAPAASGKFQRLQELARELADRQQPLLIFTQFREIMDPLQEFLCLIFGRPGLTLHGQTAVSKRQKLVDAFQREEGPPFFLLSLKAGGTGLNLTRASHVVHFDRWWNPAVENQATDRAFRIGQKNHVQVHKFITRGSLEERIDQMIQAKQKLAEEILRGDQEVNLSELSDSELLSLVRLDISQASL